MILLDHTDELDGIPPELLERVAGILPYDWLLPVTRPRRMGEPSKQLYLTEDTLNKNMNAMPGVAGHLSPHALRRKFASEGKTAGVMADGEAKMILDHLEGEAGTSPAATTTSTRASPASARSYCGGRRGSKSSARRRSRPIRRST